MSTCVESPAAGLRFRVEGVGRSFEVKGLGGVDVPQAMAHPTKTLHGYLANEKIGAFLGKGKDELFTCVESPAVVLGVGGRKYMI